MKISLELLKSRTAQERHQMWLNALRLRDTSEDARMLIELIESSGLDYQAGKKDSISIYGKVGQAMRRIIFAPEGERAALEAHSCGLPPLAGVDPLLKEGIGTDYSADNEATIQAGFLVTDLMKQHGYRKTGKQKSLPEGCVARSGALFEKDI